MTDKPVLFASMRPFERSENIIAIYNAYDGSKVHMHMADPQYRSAVLSGKYEVMVIDDFPQISTNKCIMIWHAIQGGKKIGLDQPGRPYYKPEYADNMSCIIAPGHGTVKIYAECSALPKDYVYPLGMPRTDQYIGKHKGDGCTILAGKKAYLYVPTFREKTETPMPEIDWQWLDNHMTDNELLAVKPHPNTNSIPVGDCKHIIEISGYELSAPYLYDADVVITDYSSIMFDAYLLGKPVVLFEKNPGYTETRGMYFRYPEEYCSFSAREECVLLDTVRYRARHPYLTASEKICRDIVADMCDGHSCERICDLINSIK